MSFVSFCKQLTQAVRSSWTMSGKVSKQAALPVPFFSPKTTLLGFRKNNSFEQESITTSFERTYPLRMLQGSPFLVTSNALPLGSYKSPLIGFPLVPKNTVSHSKSRAKFSHGEQGNHPEDYLSIFHNILQFK